MFRFFQLIAFVLVMTLALFPPFFVIMTLADSDNGYFGRLDSIILDAWIGR